MWWEGGTVAIQSGVGGSGWSDGSRDGGDEPAEVRIRRLLLEGEGKQTDWNAVRVVAGRLRSREPLGTIKTDLAHSYENEEIMLCSIREVSTITKLCDPARSG
ncbi:hypothetical protein AAFF_G00134490 [Aldrovandia affinis]|uniref:Uncharacterized protein n=1 Tax=Aldrovandia affinis TaxID=143900 RepID=A0AAD7R305_9TELE|nr:hypothetical protein AAFF_G00134490 [Aldrovandia affinis]